MGNKVLETCLSQKTVDKVLVITRTESGPFPYYPCENLADACTRLDVDCLSGVDLRDPTVLDTLRGFAPDVIVSATFHQIVPTAVLSLPPLGIYNIHPSILPAYKGPLPTNWAIIHGEALTGVTVHEMTPDLDEGRIALQKTVAIGQNCDGELRRRLADIAGELAEELLSSLSTARLVLRAQEGPASYHPRLFSPEGLRLLRTGRFDPANLVRGVTPWPGKPALARHLSGLMKE